MNGNTLRCEQEADETIELSVALESDVWSKEEVAHVLNQGGQFESLPLQI